MITWDLRHGFAFNSLAHHLLWDGVIVSRLLILVAFCGFCNVARAQAVGFVAPRGGLPDNVIAATSFVTINAISPSQVEENLVAAEGHDFVVNIDFSLIITSAVNLKSVKTTYKDVNGSFQHKVFEPISSNKIRKFLDDDQVREVLAPYLSMLARHKSHVGVLYLCDEPYIAGISKLQMENEARVVKVILKGQGLDKLKLGIKFASAMFDQQFAEQIELQSSRYVDGIDHYAAERMKAVLFRGIDPSDFVTWVNTIRASRLATYDLAGNMYTGGGIPAGFEVVGFDFYLSTILLDTTHEKSLSWFAANRLDVSCRPYLRKSMTDVREKLSFFGFRKSRANHERAAIDRKKLDSIYNCRMGAVLHLLQRNLGSRHPELLLVSESSANGVLDFDAKGNPKKEQQMKLVQTRVLDEVLRAEAFYLLHVEEFSAGLSFFLYEDAHDISINLKIGGVSSMPKVMRSILGYSRAFQRSKAIHRRGLPAKARAQSPALHAG